MPQGNYCGNHKPVCAKAHTQQPESPCTITKDPMCHDQDQKQPNK